MRQTASHARPQRDTSPAASSAPRLLAAVIFLTAAFALARGLFGAEAVPEGLPSPPPPTSTVPVVPTPAVLTGSPTIPTAPPTPSGPLPIGIVAGHWGSDSGAVCEDGLQEVDINLDIAERVVNTLRALGYEADLLEEFDDRLVGYRARALVSIHADSCIYPHATGFKVARVVDSSVPEAEDRLVDCLIRRYQARTGLAFHENTITVHMTQYHTFYEIDPQTPGAIIETGFMLADRDILLNRPDLVAQGIVDGILCFVEGETP